MEEVDVGDCPKVSKLMQGIFNVRPMQPKQTFIWNVQTVLNFIKENWGENKEITDKELSLKLKMLTAFTTVSRTTPDFGVSTVILNPIEIFRRWCKLRPC